MASELIKNDVQSAIVSLTLHDKGTRLGCELWRASGLIVKISHFEKPVLLTTASALPDVYHSSHATVYFKAASCSDEVESSTLAPSQFFVSSAMDHVVEHFSKQERAETHMAQYTVCALSNDLPPHISPYELSSLPLVRPGAEIQVWGSEDRPMNGTVKAVYHGEIEYAPDPTEDEHLSVGTPVFIVSKKNSLHHHRHSLSLLGLHIGHSFDSNQEKAEDGSLRLNFLSHGEWKHRIIVLDVITLHLEYSMKALKLMRSEERAKLETFLGKSNLRRDRINASLEVLDEILANPAKPPPEIFSNDDAELLATQAQGKGVDAVLTLMRVYRDDDIQFHCLEALFKLLTQGRNECAQAVAKGGGCELLALALQRNVHKGELVSAAAKCISLLAERRDISLRFLRCDIGTTLILGLRQASELGACHLEAQRWGLSAIAVLARNGLHKERMFSGGLGEIVPGLISNHPDVIGDLDLQVRGLCCIMDLTANSIETAGSSILSAGLMAALRKIQSSPVGKQAEWKELADTVLMDLDWEE